MAKKIYALLIGIDHYDPNSIAPIPHLKGCVNDINAVTKYLQERIAGKGEYELVEPTILTNEQATRQSIIDGFEKFLSFADKDDIALFYYAGHGSQEPAPAQFWHLEPDRLNETLVCYDSRTANSRDLVDKELSYLIAKVAQKKPHIVIILDCCHAGSGTRDIRDGVRRVPSETRERPWESLIFARDLGGARSLDEPVFIPQGKHITLAACRDYQEAKEYREENGQPRGVFSYFLLQTLQQTNGSLTYRELGRHLNALVSGKVIDQSPQIEATHPQTLLDQAFLGGAIPERPAYFTLSYNNNLQSWVIDGGALQGIPKLAGREETLLAIFSVGCNAEQLSQVEKGLGEARITQVLPQCSLVKIERGEEILFTGQSYWAVVTCLPLESLKVDIQGDPIGTQLASQALQTANFGQPSLYVTQTDSSQSEVADFHLVARQEQYWIMRPVDGCPLVAPIPDPSEEAGYTPERALQSIRRLEHIARWTNVLELSSPASSRIRPNDVKWEIIRVKEDGSHLSTSDISDILMEYEYQNGAWVPPTIYLQLTNQSNKTLYCNVIDLTESYAILVPFFREQTSVRLQPGQIVEGEYIDPSIAEHLWEQGVTEIKDWLKLIVSTNDFDASLLEQNGLDLPPLTRTIEPLEESDSRYQHSLNRLMKRVHKRDMVPTSRGILNDWLTKEILFTTVRPQPAEGATLD